MKIVIAVFTLVFLLQGNIGVAQEQGDEEAGVLPVGKYFTHQTLRVLITGATLGKDLLCGQLVEWQRIGSKSHENYYKHGENAPECSQTGSIKLCQQLGFDTAVQYSVRNWVGTSKAEVNNGQFSYVMCAYDAPFIRKK